MYVSYWISINRPKKILTVDGSEKRELVLHALILQELVDLVGSQGALERLAVQLLLLDLLDGQVALDTVLGAAEVATTATAGDQIGHTGTLLGEGGLVDGGPKEGVTEANHLQQADAHHGSLGIVTPAHAVNPASGQGNDVLQSTADGCTSDVAHHTDVEVVAVEQRLESDMVDGRVFRGKCLQIHLGVLATRVLVLELQQLHLRGRGRALGCGRRGVHRRGVVRDSGLGPLLLGDLIGDVGTRQGTAVDT